MEEAGRMSYTKVALPLAGLCFAYMMPWLTVFLAVVGCYLFIFHNKTTMVVIRTLPRDGYAAYKFFVIKAVLQYHVWKGHTLPMIFDKTVSRYPHKVMMTGANNSIWTFRDAQVFTNRVANYFKSLGLQKGDNVALFMENCPEYVFMWLGLSKIGVVTALVNSNLKGESLATCVNIVKAKAMIFSSKYEAEVRGVKSKIEGTCKYYCYGETAADHTDAINFKPLLEEVSSESPAFRGTPRDKLIYIYTSGTTGLPKAAVITHTRYVFCVTIIKYLPPIEDTDKIYFALPLYHISGGILGPGMPIIHGITGHVPTKFSASSYFRDCTKYHCTVGIYIGEMMRYILAQPEADTDRSHPVRLIYGHGARIQYWSEFTDRFGIKDIREIYGSTEGNANIMNVDNTPGAVGFIATICRLNKKIAKLLHPLHIIKVDSETRQPIRGPDGLCIECEPNEAGELIGIITEQEAMKFDGYVDKAATKKKIYPDVFEKGDRAFSTGDILIYDDLGYLFFKDRTGDTFRWKGENVSTNEVEGMIAKIVGLNDAVVYGVDIPGTDGKAGMVAIRSTPKPLDLAKFLEDLQRSLPPYAIPMFLRFLRDVDSTSTFKYKKNNLVKEAFDVSVVSDDLYFLDRQENKYVRLDHELHSKIARAELRM